MKTRLYILAMVVIVFCGSIATAEALVRDMPLVAVVLFVGTIWSACEILFRVLR